MKTNIPSLTNNLMIAGTMSGVGKSLLTAGLCRIYSRRGYRVAPFKSQNMALNSTVTPDGGEIATSTALQALACGREPSVEMNPILLKPTKDTASQVIINGKAEETLSAAEYFRIKGKLLPIIKESYYKLARDNDIVFIEGAGSVCELNLMKNDIVNLGLAAAVDAPVLLVGDIDRGGIFAQLYGSIALLDKPDRERIRALVVNRFRGDERLFSDGVEILKQRTRRPVAGVLPMMQLDLPEEDSLSRRLERNDISDIDIAVAGLPHISNYTDFLQLERYPEVSVRYVHSVADFQKPDMVIIPGTKNTIRDLRWLKKSGLSDLIKKYAGRLPVIGICGGYQMLGEVIRDPDGVEEGGEEEGLGLIPMITELSPEKTTVRTDGILANGMKASGYEIHAGISSFTREAEHLFLTSDGRECGYIDRKGRIAGTYMHGFFDSAEITDSLVHSLAREKGVRVGTHYTSNLSEENSRELDRLSYMMEEKLDMDLIDSIIFRSGMS